MKMASRLSVSVIIPTYNRAPLIVRALKSVLGQIGSDDEIIVIDDGSTDNTAEVLQPFQAAIKYIRVPNKGAGAARNHGVSLATKDLIAFLDSDDEWMPGKLELHRAIMQARPDILFTFSDFAITDKHEQVVRKNLRRWHNDPRPWSEILGPGTIYSTIAPLPTRIEDFSFYVGDLYPLEFQANYIFTGTLVVRREAGEAIHFAEDTPVFEDWECFGRLAQKGPAGYLDIETAWQYSHPGFRLTGTDILRSALSRIKISERVWGNDTAFLQKHSGLYQSVLEEQYLTVARQYIAQGKKAEAITALTSVPDAPFKLRALASLPAPLLRTFAAARNLLKSPR
ncbi:MAG: glycosyltransferase family 2 protein [candidate division Zixibacteria bacterium]|nr:glycosyltransferase family 2 protein [candidate division Zixibacteria bacterium]